MTVSASIAAPDHTTPMRSFDDPRVAGFTQEIRAWIAETLPAEWLADPIEELSFEDAIARRQEWDRLVAGGGLAGLNWPVEVGGRGLGAIEEYIYFQEAAAARTPMTANSIGLDVAGPAIFENGTQAQQARFLPPILRGEEFWCEGLSEPGAGSDLAAVRTSARKVDGGYLINGQKIWTSRAQFAKRCYLVTRSSAELPRHENLSVFLVDMDQPGIRIEPIHQITNEPEFSEVFFDDAFASDDELLGELHGGWPIVTLTGHRLRRRVFDAERWFIPVSETMRQLRECATHTGRCRERAAGLATETQLLAIHIKRCAELLARDDGWLQPSSILRIVWSELWQKIVDCGLDTQCPDHQAYWNHRALECRHGTIQGGSAQLQRNVVAKNVLRVPRV